MSDNQPAPASYWGRDGLGQAILEALRATGKDLNALTVDDLAPLDHFHSGGKRATVRLASLAALTPGTRVLDVGGGLGGPARTLAAQFGCQVTVIDLTESYVEAARVLTSKLGLAEYVTHHTGNALELPYDDAAFDVLWTQNSGMNLAAKEQLYRGFYRVVRPGGLLVLQEPMAGAVQPLIFPVMWARDAAGSFLRTPAEMRTLIETTGFRARNWDDVTVEMMTASTTYTGPTIQSLVMGDHLAAISSTGRRNREENRLVMIQAVFER